MDLSEIPKFDPSLFTAAELKQLQALAELCEQAFHPEEIEYAGKRLDDRIVKSRAAVKKARRRAASLNAVYKRLLHEVPRRYGKARI
jgi:translation initiation factor 2B subunit (eIF-2B alpha/beta/delta family)